MNTKQINEVAALNLDGEIMSIENLGIRTFTGAAVCAAPGKYWMRPSGNHPGHHPDDEHGDWGNLIHVKRVLVVARLFSEVENLKPLPQDILFSGLIIHDLGKYGVDGLNRATDGYHPFQARYIVQSIKPCVRLNLILDVAEGHMGRWGLTPTKSKVMKLGHYADYIASRANIHIPVKITV